MVDAEKDTNYILNASLCVNREIRILEDGKCFVSENSNANIAEVQTFLQNCQEEIHHLCSDDEMKRKWRLHTLRTHPLHAASKFLRDHYGFPSTSQAYCKFLEILTRYPRLVGTKSMMFRSFHLCEAPGHFVGALDRFMSTFYPNLQWHWEANSLNPHYEGTSTSDMLLDDHLIVAHLDRWRFGNDNSGDILKWDKKYIRRIAGGSGFDLVTADGSLYTQDSPGQQELQTLPLLKAEAEIALQILRRNGSLVIKMYTSFLPETRKLLHRISSHFKSMIMYKPMCSKSGNSERYLVCMGFSRRSKDVNVFQFEQTLDSCESQFSNWQAKSIRMNLDSFNNISNVEISIYRDKLFAAFIKSVFVETLASPFEESLLDISTVKSPWSEMFGSNYVERLMAVEDLDDAKTFLQNQYCKFMIAERTDVQSESLDVEWSRNELEFLENTEAVLLSPVPSKLLHSLFCEPVILKAMSIFVPEKISDLCSSTPIASFDYINSIVSTISREKECSLVVDAARMLSRAEWIVLLAAIEGNIKAITQFEIVWTNCESSPLILSRFSASVITFLTVLFSKFQLLHGSTLGIFSLPNYPEDIPHSVRSYLRHIIEHIDEAQQFVSFSCLTSIHPYILAFNNRQCSCVLRSIGERLYPPKS